MSISSTMLPILSSLLRGTDTYRSGVCPDPQCKSHIVFTSTDYQVQCISCGQRHQTKNLLNVEEVDSKNAFGAMRAKLQAQKPIELIKVNGISNLQCVLVSPLLSHYGMSRGGEAELLGKDKVVEESDFLDCSKIFSSRAFLIDKDHISISGYGRDQHGSQYLKDTLSMVQEVNEGEERLVPLYADGDGHCLVHAVSKCLMGREMFWHPLRLNLENHLHTRLKEYKNVLKDFVLEDEHEWEAIIQESRPDYTPPDDQTFGLRNIHIFALSNILRRPIILLDRMTHISSVGDYAATFLPAFAPPDACADPATGELNKPIVIAWNSRAHNHFIPLVGIKNRALPVISWDLLPKVWGVDQSLLDTYIKFDSDNSLCVIGGKKCMSDVIILKMFNSMEKLFTEKYKVSTGLVSEVNFCIKRNMFLGSTMSDQKWMIDSTRLLIEEGKLFRCLYCRSLNVADESESRTVDLMRRLMDATPVVACEICPVNSACRPVKADGSTLYQNGDRTSSTSKGTRCGCGFKHFWDGKEYDNLPLEVPIRLEFNQRQAETKVAWFQDESDPSLDSNAYEIAGRIVNEYFPGEFGSESIIRGVVDMLIKRVNVLNQQHEQLRRESGKEGATLANPYHSSGEPPLPPPQQAIPTKITATGMSKQTFHKEQLGASNHEKAVLNRIHENAPLQQSKASSKAALKKVPVKSSPTSPVKPPQPEPNHPKVVKKSFKLTYKQEGSGTQSVVVDITPELTFGTLVQLAEVKFGISESKQKFKMGFPPKIIKMEPNEPLLVSSGDSIIVEKLEPSLPPPYSPPYSNAYNPTPKRPAQDSPKRQSNWQMSSPTRDALLDLSNGLRDKIDIFDIVATKREYFQRGGYYYRMFMENFDSDSSKGSHFQCDMMPGKTFFYNKEEDEFFLCYEGVHIHVQPITEKVLDMVEEKRKEARMQMGGWDAESSGLSHKSFSGAIHSQAKQSKPFTGAGTRLGGGDDDGTQEDPSDPLRDPMLERILALANSSTTSTTAQMRHTRTLKDEEEPDVVHSKFPDDMDVDSN